jgi:predicted HicB family RNase H-like nuclease
MQGLAMKEPRKTRQMNLRLDEETLAKLRLVAARQGITMSELVRHEIQKAARKIAA